MENEIPIGLRVVRALAFLGLFFGLFGLFALATMVQNPLALIIFVVGLVFYICLILAINKHNKILFKITCVSLGLLILTSIVLLIMLKTPHTAIRILIEVALLGYLWKNKKYFST